MTHYNIDHLTSWQMASASQIQSYSIPRHIRSRISKYLAAVREIAAIFLLLSVGFLYAPTLSAQTLDWAIRAGGSGNDTPVDTAVDEAGNSYTTGWIRSAATFGASGPNATTLTSVGNQDIFIAKYDSASNLIWAKRAGGANFDEGRGIAIDNSGNSYITGTINGTATFGQGEANETTLTSAGGSDIFIAKYDNAGMLVWARRAGGTAIGEAGRGIAVSGSGAVFVTGPLEGSVTFGPGQPNQVVLTSIGLLDIFIAKYDNNGSLLWAKRAGGALADEGQGIKSDVSGNVYVTGWFRDTATFGAGTVNETALVSAGDMDVFLAKYDNNGLLLWARQAGGTGSDGSYAITIDAVNGIYLTGAFNDTATFGAGELNQTSVTTAGGYDIFVARYESTGQLDWVAAAGGAGTDIGRGIANNSSGGIYVTGYFADLTTFGLGEPNETLLTSLGDADIFLAKYDSTGQFLWSTRSGGIGFDLGQGVGTDATGDCYTVGAFNGSATFGSGEPNETTLSSVGDRDIFIAKFTHVADMDGDGVLDISDNCPTIPNADQEDADSDGDGNVCDPDDDNDGVADDIPDNCPFNPNNDQSDIDGDGLGDVCDADPDGDEIIAGDNCPYVPNPFQTDTDFDNQGDACDPDDDNDGVLDDYPDNCPITANASQADLDNDNIGDACDADIDGDTVANGIDNCPLVPNVAQDDADGDGDGDTCDADDDNDGVTDDFPDNCPLIINPDQSDLDGDGEGDACDDEVDGDGISNALDNCPTVPNPSQADLDSDGEGDACDDDIDGDGVANAGDLCGSTPLGTTVIDPTTGCSLEELVPCGSPFGSIEPWRNHGAYVSSITKTAKYFVDQGLINETEKGTIVSEAAGSSCGK